MATNEELDVQPDSWELLARYAADELGVSVYDCSHGREEDALFLASLQSTQGFLALGQGQPNGRGETFSAVAGFIDVMTPNAVADRYGSHYVLAFNQALFVTIVEFCLFAFTQRTVLPDIGDAAGEVSPKLDAEVLPGLFLLDRTLARGAVDPFRDATRVPRNGDRHLVAIYMALLMARFAWLHELAHCFRGHVDLAKDTGTAPRLFELEVAELVGAETTSIGPRWMVMRAFEFDADATALLMSADIQMDGIENIDALKALPLDLRLHLSQFAAFAFVSLIEALQSRFSRRTGFTHPRPQERLRNLLRHAGTIAMPEELRGTTRLALRDLVALGEAMPALDLVTALSTDADPRDMAGADHIQAILEERLAPYRYGFSPG